MRIRTALIEGFEELRGSVAVIVVAYLSSFALALPLALALGSTLRADFGHSVAADAMRTGYDDLWLQGFAQRAEGLARTFDAGVVGVGPVLDALDATVGARLLAQHPSIVAVGLAYLALWVFLTAGIVARSSRRDPAASFLAGAARHVPRFAALTGLALVFHGIVLGLVAPGLGNVVDGITRETIDERVHFAWVAAKTVVVWAMVWSVALVFDYAKILSVLEDGMNLRAAVRRSLLLVVRAAPSVLGLSAAVAAIGAALVALYWIMVPGVGQEAWPTIVGAFVLSQAFVAGKIALRCLLIASQTRLARGLVGAR